MDKKYRIIDAHAHVAQYIAGFTSRGELRGVGCGKARYATGETFQMFPAGLGDLGVSAESLLKVMDANGVEKAVLLQGNFLGFHNEYTYEAVQRYPDRFVGAATYDPFCLNVEKVRAHLFDELKFRAVKFELSSGSGLMANRPPVPLDGEVLDECFTHAEKRGLVVVLDIGRPRSPSWQVDALARAVARHGGVTFVICHLLAPQREDKELIKTALSKLVRDNVYFDISSLASNQRGESYPYPTAVEHLKNAKSIVGAGKLMFGSDMPCTLARDSYAHLKNYVFEGGIFTDDELKKVFYDNADAVYFK